MKKKNLLLILLFFLIIVSSVFAENIQLNIKEHTLKNGLKIILIEDHRMPVFTGLIMYNVGSIYESKGITGSAHLLEHMLFKGTKIMGTADYKAELPIMKELDKLAVELNREYVKMQTAYGNGNPETIKLLKEKIGQLTQKQRKYIINNDLSTIYKKNGSVNLNAWTSNEETVYFVSLPSNKLKLWAFIESDRMANPVLREFYTERDVVYEERRLGYDNEPTGKLFEIFNATAYMTCPYRSPIVGWSGDLETMTAPKVMDFYKKYYSPNNAVLVLAGDIYEKDAMKLIKEYFEPVKPVYIEPEALLQEPKQCGEKRANVVFDSEPYIFIGYHGPNFGDDDEFVLDIIADILAKGKTSRLYKQLIENQKNSAGVYSFNSSKKLGNIFEIIAIPKSGFTVSEIEKNIADELNKLKTEKVSQEELRKIKNQMEADFIRKIESANDLAVSIAISHITTGNWRNFDSREKYAKVTADDIIRVANKYFTDSNKTVAVLKKSENGENSK